MNQNQRGIVLTTGIDLPDILKLKIKNGKITNKDGSIPLIVHQYDRSENLTNMYKWKYYE